MNPGQQVIPYHHHIYLAAMVSFILGNALHGLAQVNDIARKTNQSLGKVAYDHWVPLLVRGAICMFIFLLLLEGQMEDVITALHIPLPQSVQGILNLNVNNGAIAGLAGYVFDSALGYIPFIQKLGVPPAIDAPPATPGAPTAPAPAPPK